MSHATIYTPRSRREPEPEPPKGRELLPTSAIQATGGSLGDLNRRLNLLRAELSQATIRSRELIEQRQRYEAVIDGAGPESDMAAVAAAEAGIRVLDKFLPEARTRESRISADYQRLTVEQTGVWVRLNQALAVWEGRERPPIDVQNTREWCLTTIRGATGVDLS